MKNKNASNNVYPIKNVCEMKKVGIDDILAGVIVGGVLLAGLGITYSAVELNKANRTLKIAKENMENGKILISMDNGSYLLVDANSQIKMNENGKIEFVDDLDYGENYETIKDYITDNNLPIEDICNLDEITYDGIIKQIDSHTFYKGNEYALVFYIGDLEYTIEEDGIQVLRLEQ